MKKSSKYTGVYYRDRKDGDRTYYYRYRDNNSRNVQVRVGLESNGFNEKVAFEQRQNTINAQKSEEVYQGLPDIKSRHRTTLNDIADFYFNNHKTKSTLKRQRTYDFRIRNSIGKKSIYKLQPKDIIVFRDELSEKLSPQTVIIHLELISTIYNYYIQYYTIKLTNPVLHVKKPRVDNRRERILSKEEIDLVFEELKNSFSLTLFVSLSLSTGARKSTVLNYKVKDVDLYHKTINSYDFKNKSTYKSFLDERTIKLVEYRIQQNSEPESPLVYQPGVRDLDRWVSKEMKIVFDNLFNIGLDQYDRKNRVVVHTLRHTVLSHLGMKGCNVFLLKKISNHKSTQMVERYTKLSEDVGRKEIDELWG
jgi:integrase